MSAIKVNFEIGHEASLKSKKTPEGFTHDWEVFVRGQEGADISHFVDKVVFLLHETFPKPRRGKNFTSFNLHYPIFQSDSSEYIVAKYNHNVPLVDKLS